MTVVGFLHGTCVYGRRVECLCRHFAQHLPHNAKVLDVGSGDGMLALRIAEERPDLTISGIDVAPTVAPSSQMWRLAAAVRG